MDTITTIQNLLKFNGSAQSVMVSLTPNEIRLIAAAPELLAFALRIASAMHADPLWREQALILIARATGKD